MLWFVSQWRKDDDSIELVVTLREQFEAVPLVHARHKSKVLERSGVGSRFVSIFTPLHRPAGSEDAQETSYRDRSGILHGALVLHRTNEEINSIESAKEAARQRAAMRANVGDYDGAVAEIRAIGERSAEAKGRIMREACEAMLAAFPQWTRWHDEDEARGIVRSDDPKGGA